MSDTPQNKVNIMAHFEAAVAASEVKLKDAKSALKAAKQSVDEIENAHKALLKATNAEIEKTAKLIDTLAGEDATILSTLRKKASDLQQKLELIVSDHAKSKEAINSRELTASASMAVSEAEADLASKRKDCDLALQLATAFKLKNHQANGGVAEAVEFETLEDAVEYYLLGAPVTIEVANDDGAELRRVLLVHNAGGEPSSFDLFADNKVRFMLKYLPDNLGWLKEADGSGYKDVPSLRNGDFRVDDVFFSYAPDAQQRKKGVTVNLSAAMHQGGGFNYGLRFVCFVKDSGRFYAINPKQFPSVKVVTPATKQRDYRGQLCDIAAQVADVELDASEIFHNLSRPVLAALAKRQGDFASLLNAKSAFAGKVLNAVTKVASTEHLFEPLRKRLNESEINEQVGAYWTAFITAPWEGCIDGNAAMLKHLCERKIESPHVWSNQVKGHYGLRVRTRDHTWIKAEIFCPPTFLAPSEPVLADAVHYLRCDYHQRPQMAKIGPCYIMIHN